MDVVRRTRALAPLLVCLLAVAAVTTAADARPAKRSMYPMGDSEFAHSRIGSAYAALGPSVVRQRAPARGATSSTTSSSLVNEARRWIGTNPTGQSSLWCGDFMNFVLSRTGHRVHNSRSARSFASYGRLSGPQVGAIAVLSRGTHGGHVGVVTGFDSSGNPIIVSGNVEKRVEEIPFPRSRVIAYVVP
jgi:uncharacterized protein (TIGR02594 family)